MLFLRGSVFSYARPAQLNAALIARALIERQIFSISSIILNALSANVVIARSEATSNPDLLPGPGLRRFARNDVCAQLRTS
jgi:hypothetical protein